MAQLLVRLQVRYGKVEQFSSVMDELVPLVEKSADMRLISAWRTTIGRLHECWDLWEVPPGFAGISSISVGDDATAAASGRNLMAELAECLESEELILVEKLPYSP